MRFWVRALAETDISEADIAGTDISETDTRETEHRLVGQNRNNYAPLTNYPKLLLTETELSETFTRLVYDTPGCITHNSQTSYNCFAYDANYQTQLRIWNTVAGSYKCFVTNQTDSALFRISLSLSYLYLALIQSFLL